MKVSGEGEKQDEIVRQFKIFEEIRSVNLKISDISGIFGKSGEG